MTNDQLRVEVCNLIGPAYHEPTPEEVKSGSYYQYQPAFTTSLDPWIPVLEGLVKEGWTISFCLMNDLEWIANALSNDQTVSAILKYDQSLPLALCHMLLAIKGKILVGPTTKPT